MLIALGPLGISRLGNLLNWLSGGPMPDGASFLKAAFCLLCVAVGIRFIINALRGLPRPTVTPEGIQLRSSVGTK